LALTTFAPTVTAGAAITVTPGTAALTLTTFAPTVTGFEGLADSPLNFELIAPPSVPSLAEFTSRDPQVDRDFDALARMSQVQSYLDDVEQWMNDELGTDEEMVNVFEDDSFDMDAELSGKRRP
jgi:hypothetical protein